LCLKTTISLRWHEEKCSKDGKLRHPIDEQVWKNFDEQHLDFATDSRNVRLVPVGDGFNPFRTISVSHITWLMVLLSYNFPPWWFMKGEYFVIFTNPRVTITRD